MGKIIELKKVNKWFDKFQVLKDIDLEVAPQEKIVICGPSGSGKSTLIRCINRLEEHQEGNIIVDGTELSESTKNIEKIRAEVGMVFQQFNLFPHLSILDNCSLAPIWVKKLPKKQAEEMGLDKIFIDANFEWREAGCSMCLGMNPDILSPGERCASTSNRNFEGRQGNGGRTHLVSPVMAAAAAINGHFVDVRKLNLN